jgi:hypothetical protein
MKRQRTRPVTAAVQRTGARDPTAVAAADPAPDRFARLPGPDAVLSLIRARNRRGKPMRREDVLRDEPRLVRAATKHFGSWRDAVETAGFRTPGYQRWTDDRIVNEILELRRHGRSVAGSRVPGPLREAGILHFGSWRRAIERAGLDYETIRVTGRRSPAQTSIITLLRARAETGRRGIGPDGFITQAVARRARAAFGSLRKAVKAAGLASDQVLRVPHREKVAAELLRLARERPEMTRKDLHQAGIVSSAKRWFGGIDAALAILGIEGWPRNLKPVLPGRDEILAGISRRYYSGASMRLTQVIREAPRLMKGAYKHFGTWRSAIRATGLPHEDARWSRTQVKTELRARQQRGEAMTARAIERDDPRLWAEVIARFGSLSRAMRETFTLPEGPLNQSES